MPKREWLSSAKFAELVVAKATLPESFGVRKGVASDVEAADRPMMLTFTISTDSVDRDRDTIAVEGWDLAAYKENSVVLWAHSYSTPPIGRAVKVWTEGKKLKATAEFTAKELNPFGDMIYRMYLGKFLNATSVGFQPDEWTYDEERRGVNFRRQSLLEFSSVPVPSNPQALVEARSAGIDLEPAIEWATRTLDEWSPEKGLWLQKSQVEGALKALGTTQVRGADLDLDALAAKVAAHLAPPPTVVDDLIEILTDEPTLEFDDTPASAKATDDRIDITDEQIRDLVQHATHAVLADVVPAAVKAAINRHTGRVD